MNEVSAYVYATLSYVRQACPLLTFPFFMKSSSDLDSRTEIAMCLIEYYNSVYTKRYILGVVLQLQRQLQRQTAFTITVFSEI